MKFCPTCEVRLKKSDSGLKCPKCEYAEGDSKDTKKVKEEEESVSEFNVLEESEGTRQIGASGLSLISQPWTMGITSFNSETRPRMMRDLACPLSPKKTM